MFNVRPRAAAVTERKPLSSYTSPHNTQTEARIARDGASGSSSKLNEWIQVSERKQQHTHTHSPSEGVIPGYCL